MTNRDHIADRRLNLNRQVSLETRAGQPCHLLEAFT